MGLAPGYLVTKHVRLVRELKRGGMGSVWVADHLALEAQVAVKFMAASIVDDAAAVARFAREATSAARIKSPHVVQIHDHGVTPEGVPYMVMELCHGEDLSTRLKRDGTISLEDATQIVIQVCRVLGRAHQHGIVHRDIKPSNIFLLDADGEIFVKVLDFGVAKLGEDGSELTTTGAMVGTLVYMSPEQLLHAKSVDHRADLWSLAVVIYKALTGDLPFKNDDGLGALCRAVEDGSFPAPSTVVPSLPPEVDAWFERAFAPEIDARFKSAREMAEALHRAGGRASPPPSMPSSMRPPPSGDDPVRAGHGGGHPRTPAATEPTASARGTSPRAVERTAVSPVHGGGQRADEGTAATATPAQTLAGTEASPSAPRGRTSLLLAICAALLAGGLGAVGVMRWSGAGRAKASGTTGAPVGAPMAAPLPPVPAPAATSASAPVAATQAPPEVVPASAKSAAPSPAASASAAPAASASAKARVRPAGPRSAQPEKDYGF